MTFELFESNSSFLSLYNRKAARIYNEKRIRSNQLHRCLRPNQLIFRMKLLILFVLGVSTCALGALVPRPRDGAEVEDTTMEPVSFLRKKTFFPDLHRKLFFRPLY